MNSNTAVVLLATPGGRAVTVVCGALVSTVNVVVETGPKAPPAERACTRSVWGPSASPVRSAIVERPVRTRLGGQAPHRTIQLVAVALRRGSDHAIAATPVGSTVRGRDQTETRARWDREGLVSRGPYVPPAAGPEHATREDRQPSW